MKLVLPVAVTWCALAWYLGPALDHELTPVSEGASPAGATVPSENLYQGRNVRWWARRAVQARKDANARGRTIRRLQSVARGKLAYPTGHWLDGAFMCIHRFEGSWRDPNPPYWGGVQMDMQFQRTYGAWALAAFGTADRWPVSVQIAVAIQAWTTRGFGPWPNTRRMCGL